MLPVCPATGHVVLPLQGRICPDHGVPWFVECPSCRAAWPLVLPMDDFAASELFDLGPERARDFCANCGTPGPWVTRPQLMEWLRSNVKASVEVPASERLELLEVLTRLEAVDANDTKSVAAWERVRKLAPKVWEKAQPVRDALIGEAVKKLLGL